MEMSPTASRAFANLLEERTGQILSANRAWRIETVLKPVMREREVPSLDAMARMIGTKRDAGLANAVVEALLNNETFFFRELSSFQQLAESALDRIVAARAAKRRLRILSVGCSTGQEAYSLAMMLADQGSRWEGWNVEIVGTDVSRIAIDRAREGIYSQFEIQRGLPVRQMMRWFESDGENWRAIPALRSRVRFQVHNLLDPPVSPLRFDVILCRNVLLYFSPETRAAAFRRLGAAIAPDGVLMLGAGETTLGQTDLFVSDSDNRGLYRLA